MRERERRRHLSDLYVTRKLEWKFCRVLEFEFELQKRGSKYVVSSLFLRARER